MKRKDSRLFKRQNKGVTLVALIITIIILLILAGLSISMILGENGVLKKATKVKDKYELEQELESKKLNEYTKEFAKLNGEVSSLLPKFSVGVKQKDGVTIEASDDASEEFSSGYTEYACDGKDNTGWATESGNYGQHWFLVKFDDAKVVKRYYLKGAFSWGTQHKFYLQASEDGENWMSLEDGKIHDGISGYNPGEWNIDINNTNAYNYYRILFIQGGWTYGSSGGWPIAELELYGY